MNEIHSHGIVEVEYSGSLADPQDLSFLLLSFFVQGPQELMSSAL